MATTSDGERRYTEQQAAVRLLLGHPLAFVDRPDPVAFSYVLQHAEPLAQYFRDTYGWTLLVDPRRRFARLAKRTFDRDDATRGVWLRERQAPFDPFRYTLLCLALAAIDALPSNQALFSRLVDDIHDSKRVNPALPDFDPVELAHRRAINDVFAYLEELRVLTLREGDAQRYFDGVADDDPFYDVDRGVLAALLATTSSPSLAADRAASLAEPYPETERGRLDRARHGVYRRLADDPVVLEADLSTDERTHLLSQLGVRIRDDLSRMTGLVVERRAEGVAAIDEEGDLHDGYRLPAEGVLAHAALLTAEWFADHARAAGRQPTPLPDEAVTGHVRHLIAIHRRHWGKTYREAPAGVDRAATLAGRVTAFLEGLALIRLVDGGWMPRPPVARFRAGEIPAAPASARAEQLLLADGDPAGAPA